MLKGTRVPIRSLFEYLEDNYTLKQFVECFPSVTVEQLHRLLECSQAALLGLKAA